jgi:hypothetical protein
VKSQTLFELLASREGGGQGEDASPDVVEKCIFHADFLPQKWFSAAVEPFA